MTATFNPDEIFELAMQIERFGGRFYRLAADRTADTDAKRLLLDLAGYEDLHEQTFGALRAQAATARAADRSDQDDLDDVVGQYLRAMANGVVFDPDGDPAGRLRGDETLEQLLRVALDMEQASIAFYSGIQRAMPAAWGPDQVEVIIKEEMAHVVFIAGELARRHGASV